MTIGRMVENSSFQSPGQELHKQMEQNTTPNPCPACGAENLSRFYSEKNIPVHSVQLIRSRDEAVKFPTGQIDLAHCPVCGFICNLSYQPELQDYSAEYESTQAYSSTFNSFAYRLAQHLIERYELQNKKIIEIGCGQGEFLSLLCQLGGNYGTGFDPAYNPTRSAVQANHRLEIIPDYYSEKYSSYQADFFCCKMTLEHIRDVADFIAMVRRSIGDQKNTTVFFQVPAIERVLKEVAFWDIYYEHCSYFSMGSLSRLFRSQGFEVREVWRDYSNQYLMIDSQPGENRLASSALSWENDLEKLAGEVATFAARVPEILDTWKRIIQNAYQQDQKVVLWGSGSKGVAFLTTLDLCGEVEYTVDINPNKHGTYMAGTGQKIVSPDFLMEYQPDLIILMNPIYRREVQEELNKRGLSARIVGVGE